MFNDFSILKSIFPAKCFLCQQPTRFNQWCCRSCRQSLPFIQFRCPICAIPMPSSAICGQCLNKKPYFDHSLSVFKLSEPIKSFISRFKYNHNFYLGKILAYELVRHIQSHCNDLPDLIVPIPLHRRRLFFRGFNQSALLSSSIAKQLNIPHKNNLLIRHKFAQPQTQLDAKQRHAAVKDAFSLKRKWFCPHVAIVDDVVTTTNTVNQAAKALKKSGIKKITVWSIARNT